MKVTVSAWDPGYSESSDRITDPNKTRLNLDVEVDSGEWRPMKATVPPPSRVLLVDGVRRLDARVDIDVDGQPSPGLCASYAAGVVVCDLAAHSRSAAIAASRVERGLFSAAAQQDLSAGLTVSYRARRVHTTEPNDLVNAVQERLTRLEIDVAGEADPTEDDLLVIDGALRHRAHLPRAVGFVKSHHRRYLSGLQADVVHRLEPGQRTPVFEIGTNWRRHSWYLRLPGGSGAWGGVARLEAPSTEDLAIDEVVRLADTSTVVLPGLASSAHKDPRAPQNLTPIAGLERMLRAKLGDPRLLLRNLRSR
ncbi:MAG TPA: hypothetical protein H9881_14200 [Candidatus Stackebrandtia excrementipullorum]|nr:hypothetical protein [Candidatus Stackebrandtia excrementipullorum]